EKEAVLPAVGPGGEVNGIGTAAAAAVSHLERPQPVDHDLLSERVDHLAEEFPGGGIERVDAAVTEIAYQHVTREPTEARGRLHQPPRRIQMPVLGESATQRAVEIE